MYIATCDLNHGRFYQIRENNKDLWLPSVTTILGHGIDKSWIEEWKNTIGEEKAQQISTLSANRGTVLHYLLENYFEKGNLSHKEFMVYHHDKLMKNGFTEKEWSIGKQLFSNFFHYKDIERIKKVIFQEVAVWSIKGGGFAGRIDIVFENRDDILTIGDFKSSKKEKQKKNILGYRLQVAAYSIAYYDRYGKFPTRAEIMISCETGELQIFEIEKKELHELCLEFLDMVKSYHESTKINIFEKQINKL